MKKYLVWLLVAVPVVVFLQSLPFKFSAHPETQHIFGTIGAWFGTIGLDAIAQPFAAFGGYGVGAVELVAAVLLIIPATRHWGALLGFGVLTGAIFFHLVTPLGVYVKGPSAPVDGDPTLFVMAVISWLCLGALVALYRHRLPLIGGAEPVAA